MSLSLHEDAQVGRMLSAKRKPKSGLESRVESLERLCESLQATIVRCERKIEKHQLGRVLIDGRLTVGHPDIQEVRAIIMWVAYKCGTTADAILSRSRHVEIAWFRQIAMWIARKSTHHSTNTIGKAFRRTHGAILHGQQSVENQASINKATKAQVDGMLAEWIQYKQTKESEYDFRGSQENRAKLGGEICHPTITQEGWETKAESEGDEGIPTSSMAHASQASQREEEVGAY